MYDVKYNRYDITDATAALGSLGLSLPDESGGEGIQLSFSDKEFRMFVILLLAHFAAGTTEFWSLRYNSGIQ